ncbi:MAG: GGDEF domain-containing protein [Aeromicrobium sp.]
MTTLAAAVIATTGVLDLFTGSVNVSTGWTVCVSVVALVVAALPALLGARFPPAVALAACWVFMGVTSLQASHAQDAVMAVNNLVLYPMISCYLGWFFNHRLARINVTAMFVLSGWAVWLSGLDIVFTTWANLALASFFCLEAALYLRSKLNRQIETDPLTGALNRHGLAARLGRELSHALRTGSPLAVAAIDLDGFKAINDRFGHAAGDQALVSLVTQLEQATRPHDQIARTGGDEFVLLLPDTGLPEATALLDRLQAESSVAWTYGLVTATRFDTEESVTTRADDELYLNKNKRERGVSADPTS